LVAGFIDLLNGPVVFDAAPGVSLSTDGGKSWVSPKTGQTLPDPPGFLWGSRTLETHLAGADPAVAWGLGKTVYYSTLGFHDNEAPPNNDCSSGGLYVYRSDDGGNTWTLPADSAAIPNTQTVFRDKEYIAVDSNPSSSFAGKVYMVWDDDVYSDCPQVFPDPQEGVIGNFVTRNISFSSSSDGGATWSEPTILATGCLVTPVPAVAANGDLYVVWFDCNAGIQQLVRKSTDGGESFGTAVAAASALSAPPNPLIGSKFRVNAAFPAIATDPTDADRLYVTWSSNNGTSQTDVFVSRSLNGGDTWSAPVRVNDDPLGNPRDQFFPWVAVDDDGIVRVMWGDDRLDLVNTGGKLYDIFLAKSTDHGATFGPNIRVTTESSDPDFDGFGGTFIGDYFGLSASGLAVWADTRGGNQDIFGGPPLPSIINDLVSFVPLSSTFNTTSNISGCPTGFVGKFSFDAKLTDKTTSPALRDLVAKVTTLTNGNLLQNADGAPGGVGATLTIARMGDYSDGLLSPGEFVDVPFTICLKNRNRFTFFVDVLGIEGDD
jgi:hypothetical protein